MKLTRTCTSLTLLKRMERLSVGTSNVSHSVVHDWRVYGMFGCFKFPTKGFRVWRAG